jgi:hypothetical protein
MTESPYAIPLEDLIRRTWIPLAEQVVEQPGPTVPPTDWSSDVPLGNDGCDADGE